MSTVLAVLLAVSAGTWLDVPFTRQAKDGCGSAAIWMLMSYWRPADTPAVAEIHHDVFSPEAHGVYASTMESYLASHGFRPLHLTAEWSDLQNQLTSGRPLIVSIEADSRGLQLHYVVVAGLDDANGIVYLNDPADRKLTAMRRMDFEKRWKATGNWTLLALPEVASSKAAEDDTAIAVVSAPATPELIAASNAFRNEKYTQSRSLAFKVLRQNPEDPTINDLIATTYYLQNNFEAALKYWNRLEKPKVHDLRVDPPAALDPVRLERLFEFSRGSELTLEQYRRTLRNLDASGVFSGYAFDMTPADSKSYDMTFRASDRSGFHYISAIAGLPFQTVRPGFTDIGGETTNLDGLLRWDSRKERAWFSLSAPAWGSGSARWKLEADARREEWDHSGNSFVLRKFQTSFGLQSQLGSRGSWSSSSTGGVHQHRKTLGYLGRLEWDVFRIPENRLVLTANSNIRLQRLAEDRFAKLDEDLYLKWLPQTSGNDWQFSLHLNGGWTSKSTPLDELFALGIDRDDPGHLLRAHRATQDGRKGAAIFSNRYALLNADVEKTIHNFTLGRLAAAPFLDIARTNQWLVDSGVELRVHVAFATTLALSLGRDLRSGKTIGYAR